MAREPVVIDARETRQGREELRVAFSEYRGFPYLDVRRWWRDGEGAFRPGKGITVRPSDLPWLVRALEQAIEVGLREGLIDEEAFESIGAELPGALTE